jgi:TonB-linked SusC/RagA family outer membrane protein
MSANLKDETTILKGNEYLRFGARINLEHQLTERLRAGGNMMLTHVDDQQVPTSWAGGVGSVNTMLPIWPVYKEDGSYFYLSDSHPVAGVALRNIHLTSNQILGNWFLSINIAEGLSLRTEFGANLLFNDDFHYRDGRITSHGRTVSSTVIGKRISWNWKNILNYKKRIGEHSFDVLAATDMQRFNQRINTIYGDTYFNSALQKPSDAAIVNASYFETGYSFMSFIGRLNYNFRDRYLLAFSMRADGSSRLGVNNRWGYFPAGSVGYILSEEGYFSPLKKVFNFFKLRVSYGIVGNAEIGDYSWVSNYGTTTYNGNTGIYLTNLGDDRLGWERTTQLDVGLTWEAANGRISGELDVYDKYTSDLLLPVPVSLMTGVSTVTRNVGELSNRGVEFMINTRNIAGQRFTWETNLTLAHNVNEVLSLSDEIGEGLSVSEGLGGFTLFVGKPVGVIAMVEWGGVDPETGEDTYVDSDGNQLLFSEVLDQYGNLNNFYNEHNKPMGNPWPKISGGLDNRFTWKNWYLNMLITFATGMDFLMGEQKTMLTPFGSTKTNPTEFMLERWREPGDVAPVSKVRVENINWTNTSEHLHRTDYIRLKDLTLGYRFRFEAGWISGLNCYAKFTNLLTFTKAPDFFWDPEYTGVVQNRTQNNLNAGESYKAAPQATFYILGVSLEF